LVDETVVVDTGSTDRSKQIATEAGARVEDFAWTADFSAARNRALELARGEWILYIDSDETARPGGFDEIRAQLADPAYVGHNVSLHPRPGHTPYWILRLFRNDPRIRFRGIIHESVWPAIRDRHWQSRIGFSRLTLDHLGYEGGQDAKHARNLPLLHKSLRQDPTRVFSWCHLGEIYAELGKPRFAVWAWRKALDLVRSRAATAPDDYLPYSRLVQWMLDHGEDSSALISEALERFPSNAYLWWQQGQVRIAQRRFESAIPVFERLLAFGRAGDFDRYVACDVRIFGALAYEALAGCHFQLGDFAESRRYYDLAAGADPERLEYRVKRALCSRLQRGSR